jgi:hypothetical protein
MTDEDSLASATRFQMRVSRILPGACTPLGDFHRAIAAGIGVVAVGG